MTARSGTAIALLLLACLSMQAMARQVPAGAGGRRLLATPPPKGRTNVAPTIKFNGTHIELPFAPPGFNGTIVCPKNGSHPLGPPRPPLSMLRGGAQPPHGAMPLRPPRGARPPAPPGTPAFNESDFRGPHGPRGGPEGHHGFPQPTLVNVTGALNASLPILAYNGTGPVPNPCPGMDGPGGPHGGPHGGPGNGPSFLLNAPPGTPAANLTDGPGGGGPGGFGGPGGDGPGGMGGGPGGMGGGGPRG